MNSPSPSPSTTKKTWETPKIETLQTEQTLAGLGTAKNEFSGTGCGTALTDDSGTVLGCN